MRPYSAACVCVCVCVKNVGDDFSSQQIFHHVTVSLPIEITRLIVIQSSDRPKLLDHDEYVCFSFLCQQYNDIVIIFSLSCLDLSLSPLSYLSICFPFSISMVSSNDNHDQTPQPMPYLHSLCCVSISTTITLFCLHLLCVKYAVLFHTPFNFL